MRKLLLASLVWGFAMSIGTSAALADGTSDTSGKEFHCYMFFDCGAPNFAQVMINGKTAAAVIAEFMKLLGKYESDAEECILVQSIGNVTGVDGPPGFLGCAEPIGG